MNYKEKIEVILFMIEHELNAGSPDHWTVEDHVYYLKFYLSKIKKELEEILEDLEYKHFK